MKCSLLGASASIIIAALAMGPANASQTLTEVSAARAKTAYASKKAECRQRAKSMNFGVHFVKRNRWIKDCIAGAH
jgi:hypothetical protein